jgi:hypothetical protein
MSEGPYKADIATPSCYLTGPDGFEVCFEFDDPRVPHMIEVELNTLRDSVADLLTDDEIEAGVEAYKWHRIPKAFGVKVADCLPSPADAFRAAVRKVRANQ